MTALCETEYPRLVPVADSALLIEFENQIDEEINDRVLKLKDQLDELCLFGVREVVSSYRSLLIHYDCVSLSLSELKSAVELCLNQVSERERYSSTWKVPVLYGGETGADLESVAKYHDLTTDEVIRLHLSVTYRIYLVGFAPGWCYLGGLDARLHTPRLDTPRLKVPPGCISIGGQQSMIGALPMPSGWRLLGQTAVRTYSPNRNPPFILQAGDHIQFYSVSRQQHELAMGAAERGELVAEQL